MHPTILRTIKERHNLPLSNSQPLYGGDINAVYRCDSPNGVKVVKCNSDRQLADMFAKEASGLEALRAADAFLIPKVYGYGNTEAGAYLVLEYLRPGSMDDWSEFGRLLAQQHRSTAPQFGFPEANYIGSLVQPNEAATTAAAFFIEQRLEPQFRLAKERGFSFSSLNQLYRRAEALIPAESPALLHGDLWSGNYLSTERGFALIDPAVSYGPREMDLAMMHLFGGFPPPAFTAYQESLPTAPGLAERIPLYQLYYVLVHVNLFGGGYHERAQAIIRQYL
jgi:fructosamine-3-kinase